MSWYSFLLPAFSIHSTDRFAECAALLLRENSAAPAARGLSAIPALAASPLTVFSSTPSALAIAFHSAFPSVPAHIPHIALPLPATESLLLFHTPHTTLPTPSLTLPTTSHRTECGAASAPKCAACLPSAPALPATTAPGLNQRPCRPPLLKLFSPVPPAGLLPAYASPLPATSHPISLQLSVLVFRLRPSQSKSAGFHVDAPPPADSASG